MKKFALSVLVIMLLVVSVQFTMAQSSTMKIAWSESADPFEHMVSAGMYVFKKTVEEYTGGSIEVQLYPAGQLGDAKSTLEQVKEGVIQGCMSIPSGLIAGRYYPDFYIFDVPYLFNNNAVAWEVLNPSSDFMKGITEDLAENTGLLLLNLGIEGMRHFTNNETPIKSPDDIRGLKIRTMEVPAHMEMVKALGGSPIPVPWLELYTALQTGVVDGEENPVSNINYMKFYEVQKYLTLDGHITLLDAFVINDKWFKAQSESNQKAILQAAQMMALAHRGMNEILEGKGLEVLQEKMEVTYLTAEEKMAFKEATQGPVIEYIKSQISRPELLDELLEKVKEVESK